jgi:ribosomal protein L11 methylase PrmA
MQEHNESRRRVAFVHLHHDRHCAAIRVGEMERDALIAHTKLNGSLILSGLLKHQAKDIIESYSKKGMKLISHLEKGDWTAILFKKEKA